MRSERRGLELPLLILVPALSPPASPLGLAGLHRPWAKPLGPGDSLVMPLEK